MGGPDEQPSGRVWLVTGASSGFGRAITQEIAGRGDIVGNDAVDAIVDQLDTAREEIRTWEATARATQIAD